jgi:hypothetical protein
MAPRGSIEGEGGGGGFGEEEEEEGDSEEEGCRVRLGRSGPGTVTVQDVSLPSQPPEARFFLGSPP